MAAINIYNLQMDTKYNATNDTIKITQNDHKAVVLSMAITENDTPLDITGNNVNIVIGSKDNIQVCSIIDATKGLVEYAITSNDSAVVGVHEFLLELITANSRLSTQRWKYTVVADLNV